MSLSTVISRDPTDPTKTRMAILAHADPGGGVPQWVSFYGRWLSCNSKD
jgi:hypothetical protein